MCIFHFCLNALNSRQGKCKKKTLGLDCEVGMRKRTCYVLAGSVLSVWSKLEAILSTQVGSSTKMQIIRLKLDDGNKIVGMFHFFLDFILPIKPQLLVHVVLFLLHSSNFHVFLCHF